MNDLAKTRESRQDVLQVVRYRMFCLLRDGGDIEEIRTTYTEIERLLDALGIPHDGPIGHAKAGDKTVTVRVPEGYDSVRDFLMDCGLEAVYPASQGERK